jgi:hypothetical protein
MLIARIIIVAWWLGLALFLCEFKHQLGPLFPLKKNLVVFSNDGPLGVNVSQAMNPDTSAIAVWSDLNHVGLEGPRTSPWSTGLRVLLWHPQIAFALAAVVGIVLLVFKTMRFRILALNIIFTVACFGLLIGCLLGRVDPYESKWMLIYPVAFFVSPLLMMATLLDLENETND